jgi:hypothetical protein
MPAQKSAHFNPQYCQRDFRPDLIIACLQKYELSWGKIFPNSRPSTLDGPESGICIAFQI